MIAIACVVGYFAFCLTQHSLPEFLGVILLLTNANMWHRIRERCEKENKQLEILVCYCMERQIPLCLGASEGSCGFNCLASYLVCITQAHFLIELDIITESFKKNNLQ